MNLRAGLQKVRSFSPSEEKHCSTYWSDTPSSVDGFHLGLWSLSTNTANTRIKKILLLVLSIYLYTIRHCIQPPYATFVVLALQTLTSSYTLIKVAASLQKHQKQKHHEMTTFLITNTNVADNDSNSSTQQALKLQIIPCRPGSADTPSPTRPAGSESRPPAAAYG